MKTIPLTLSTRNALEVAIDSAIDAQDLLLGSDEPEDVAMGKRSLEILGCYKSFLELRPNVTEVLVLEPHKGEIFTAVDALLDEQRSLITDGEWEDLEHMNEIAHRIEALEALYAHLNPLNPFKP